MTIFKHIFSVFNTACITLSLLFISIVVNAETMRQYQFEKNNSGYDLKMKTVSVPSISDNEILVRIRATSLNRRDIYIFQSGYRGADSQGLVPLSDGAGEVISVGKNVSRFKAGDRVAGTFFENWKDGNITEDGMGSARGGDVNGMLSEMIVANENNIVKIPDYMSYEEASTIPCAGVTAWNGLFKAANLKKDEYVLLEGTGGVSTWGLILASAAGAKPIITSSSDEKLQRAKTMGAVGTANYRQNPEWQEDVLALTDGAGVSHVLEIGGKDTLPRALKSLAFGGHIANIGGLTGFGAQLNVAELNGRQASVTGIYVGSQADFEAMNVFLQQHQIRPLIDKVFPFEEAASAYDYMKNGSFMGKIVISLSD
jgi:NADPH:quinone reductase-like Zn-dependent oxidoreductase